MHEASLMRGLVTEIERVAQESNAAKVVSVDVWMGALTHLSAGHMREHFSDAARGSIAEGAELTLNCSDDVQHAQAQLIILKGVEVLDQEIDA